jgi:hypothetical protein
MENFSGGKHAREEYRGASDKVEAAAENLREWEDTQEQHRREGLREHGEVGLSLVKTLELLPANIGVLLAKRKLSSAEAVRQGTVDEAHEDALAIEAEYEKRKTEVVQADQQYRNAIQQLATFETEHMDR